MWHLEKNCNTIRIKERKIKKITYQNLGYGFKEPVSRESDKKNFFVVVLGHIPLSEGWTSVRIIKLATTGAGYAPGPCKRPLGGPLLGVSEI